MSIPLHAAHPFQTKADVSKEPCLEDLYICSYTPILSVLVKSKQMMNKRVPPSFVAIGQGRPGAFNCRQRARGLPKARPLNCHPYQYFRRCGHTSRCARGYGKEQLGAPCLSWQAGPYTTYNSHFVMKDEHLTLLHIKMQAQRK
jgi:hypothetical protein